MGHLIRNQYGVVTVNDEASIHEPKKIRFITPDYKELFHIADGGQILISYQDGTKKAMTCQYLDDYHLLVGHNAFHICEFAERMEQIGAHVEPFSEKLGETVGKVYGWNFPTEKQNNREYERG